MRSFTVAKTLQVVKETSKWTTERRINLS